MKHFPRMSRDGEIWAATLHQLKIARATLKMPDEMIGVMGGMTKEQAREIVARWESKPTKKEK